jgi:Fur family ferric uptake transcriptional regulator
MNDDPNGCERPLDAGLWRAWAWRRLTDRGHRAGGARAAVIAALAETGGGLSAAELVDLVRSGPGDAGQASVYRTLALLADLEIIRGVDVGDRVQRYELVRADGHHHHHVVCERCGRTTMFEDAGLETAIERVSAAVGYRIDAHDVILRGACPDCAAA